MDTTDVSSYRPISNPPVLSKLLERLVVRQLMDYLQSADLLPANQSGFRPGHSTETAVLRVLSDILLAVGRRYAVLRQLHSIRHSVPATTFQTLIVSLVLSRLDYGNAALAGLSVYRFRRLQSVMNAAAWLIYGLRHSDDISNAIVILH